MVAVALAVAGCGDGSDSDASQAGSGEGSEKPGATRDALAQTDNVNGAPDRTLALSRVDIPSGVHLDLHQHQGTQVARIDSGVLTYTVEEGTVVVRRGPSDGESSVVRKIRAGETGKIRAGEWLVEQPSDVHRAENSGSEPVVVYLSTLLETGAPAATPVNPGPGER